MNERGADMFYCAHQAYICAPCDIIIWKHEEGCVLNAVTVENSQTTCVDNLNLRVEALLLNLRYLQEFLTSIMQIFLTCMWHAKKTDESNLFIRFVRGTCRWKLGFQRIRHGSQFYYTTDYINVFAHTISRGDTHELRYKKSKEWKSQ